ncbi:MAG: CoA-binding protein [Ignavibacteria bacterium]|jgi:predicted CoA-binding protein
MELIHEILDNVKTIAVIGMKDDVTQDAYRIPYYMSRHGYQIYPVNPGKKGKKVMGEIFAEKVSDLKAQIDLVDIFRRPEFIPAHVKEILAMNPLPKYVWFQLGIKNDEAAKELERNGIKVVQDRCLLIEHRGYKG